MQDEYGLTLKEGEADMYKHSTNRDVRYAERELHFVIPPLYRELHIWLSFLILNAKDANRPLIPSSDTGAASYLPVNISYQELSYHSISHSQNEALVLPEYNRVNIITLN